MKLKYIPYVMGVTTRHSHNFHAGISVKVFPCMLWVFLRSLKMAWAYMSSHPQHMVCKTIMSSLEKVWVLHVHTIFTESQSNMDGCRVIPMTYEKVRVTLHPQHRARNFPSLILKQYMYAPPIHEIITACKISSLKYGCAHTHSTCIYIWSCIQQNSVVYSLWDLLTKTHHFC